MKGNDMSMTTMEAKAEALAFVLSNEPSTWAKAQSDSASQRLQKLLADGKIDAATFSQAMIELCGNHSATRQLLEKHGVFAVKSEKPAFLVQAMKRVEAIQKELDELAAKAPKKA